MSKIFSLSEAGSIAIHSMILIAQSDKKLNVQSIAERTQSSRHHIAKVMQRLVKEGFLKSNRGPRGGFSLNRPPEEINFLDIYESIEGKIKITDCPMENAVCPFESCIFENVIQDLTGEFIEYLKGRNISQFL
jgi:Rrf2 family protein